MRAATATSEVQAQGPLWAAKEGLANIPGAGFAGLVMIDSIFDLAAGGVGFAFGKRVTESGDQSGDHQKKYAKPAKAGSV